MAVSARTFNPLLLAIILSAACGRIGFESVGGDGDAAITETDAAPARSLAPALARYWINEASSMQGVSELIDDTPNPFPLPLTYAANTPLFADQDGGGRHLRFQGEEDVGSLAAIAGSKFEALYQATEVTFEMKLLVDACDSHTNHQRMFGFSDGTTSNDTWLGIRSWNPGGEQQRVGIVMTWAGRDRWTFFYTKVCPETISVLHWVVDTNQEQPEDRVRIYYDGLRIPVFFFGSVVGDSDWPPLGATIELQDSIEKPQKVYLGQALDGLPRTNAERIYYTAVYSEALSEVQILDHTATLSAVDD